MHYWSKVVVQFDFNLASTGSASVFLIKRLMTELVEVSFNKTNGQTVPLPGGLSFDSLHAAATLN